MSNKRFTILPEFIQQGFLKIIEPVIDGVVRLNVHPHFFTILGFILSLVSGYFFGTHHVFWGGVFLLLSGICDIFDGKVARKSGLASKFGAVLDSSLDRYAEMAVYLGIGIYFIQTNQPFTAVMVFVALGGSLMVSYVRARAEGLGYDGKVGLMQRPERIVYLGISALFHPFLLKLVIWGIAVLANFTAIQRIYHVYRQEKEEKESQKTFEEPMGI